ncbi:MAG: hypothetical protein QXS38_00920 [Candidatus Pacearchaeota archaeon]
MLEVVIASVWHSSEKEARKLLPFMKQCDVFSYEESFRKEQELENLEKSWQDLLTPNNTLTKFRKVLRQHLSKIYANPGQLAYILKLLEYGYRDGKILFFAERHNDDINKNKKVWVPNEWKMHLIPILKEGDFEEFFRLQAEWYTECVEETTGRDKNIADNIKKAEDAIRKRFPTFATKEKINYLIQIGADHAPQDYLRDISPEKIRIVEKNLCEDYSKTPEYRLYRAFKQKLPINDEIRRDLLASTILRLPQLLQPLNTNGELEQQILLMSLPNLKEYFLKNRNILVSEINHRHIR